MAIVTRIKRPSARLKTILSSEATYATTLLTIFADLFGYDSDNEHAFKEACQWHPTTIRMELEEEIGAPMPPINGDKLNTAIMLLTTDSFFRRVDPFIKGCNVLSGTALDVGAFDKADARVKDLSLPTLYIAFLNIRIQLINPALNVCGV